MMQDSQESLVRRSQLGQIEAFGQLVKLHAPRAVAAAYGMLGCYDEALDAFVRACRGVRLEFHNGKHLLIGSQRSEELAAAIEMLLKQSAQG